MKIEKVENLVSKIVMHIRNLKQALDYALVLKLLTSNQETWSKPYIAMNTDLRKNTKTDSKNTHK